MRPSIAMVKRLNDRVYRVARSFAALPPPPLRPPPCIVFTRDRAFPSRIPPARPRVEWASSGRISRCSLTPRKISGANPLERRRYRRRCCGSIGRPARARIRSRDSGESRHRDRRVNANTGYYARTGVSIDFRRARDSQTLYLSFVHSRARTYVNAYVRCN